MPHYLNSAPLWIFFFYICDMIFDMLAVVGAEFDISIKQKMFWCHL